MKNSIYNNPLNSKGRIMNPVFVQLELTENCNHFCQHCYNPWNYSNNKRENIKLDSLREILIRLEEAKIFDLTLTGGEPLIHNKAVDFILEQKGRLFTYDTGINTNLTILPADYSKLNGSTILFSYPAYSQDTWKRIVGVNDQDRVLKNLEKIISFVPVQANMAVSKLNLNEVFKAGEFLYKTFGLDRFAATPTSPVNGVDSHKQITLSKEEVLKVLEQLRELKRTYGIEVDVLETLPLCLIHEDKENYIFFGRCCSAGKTTVTISATGDIRPCSRASQKYGNILRDNLDSVWKKMSIWRSLDILPSNCKNCATLSFCGGGCRVNGEACTKSIQGEDIWTEGRISESELTEIINGFQAKRPSIDTTKKFRIKHGLRFRREGEDTNITYYDGNFLLVNDSLAKFLKNNQGRILNLSNEHTNLNSELYYSKLIEEVKNERKY